jgi:hypothetical protein
MSQIEWMPLEYISLFKCIIFGKFGNIEALRAALARNGPEKKIVLGMGVHVLGQTMVAVWKYLYGPEKMDAIGI